MYICPRYEAYVCCDNKTEQLASGSLEQLRLHVPQVKLAGHCKLQLPDNLKRSAWFSKSLSRFLHIVDTPEMLKIANACGVEMTQLEELRRFHLALYAQVLHAGSTNKYAFKALIFAEYIGVKVELVKDFEMGVSNKTFKFLEINPIVTFFSFLSVSILMMYLIYVLFFKYRSNVRNDIVIDCNYLTL